jgi:large subunit ribosomal protein L25
MSKLARVTQVTIKSRAAIGTTGARGVRRAGDVPGVLYGHGTPLAIAIASKDLHDLLATGGLSHIIDATVDGKHDSVLLRGVQRDPITRLPIAADFQRISTTESVNATVAVVTTGVAPGVKNGGGVLDVVTHALEIKGPAGRLPEQLEIDVSGLDVGQHITAGQVTLPAGFALVTLPETTVVSIEITRAAAGGEAEEGAAPDAGATGEATTAAAEA